MRAKAYLRGASGTWAPGRLPNKKGACSVAASSRIGAPTLLPHHRIDGAGAQLLRRWVVFFIVAEVVGFGIAAPVAAGGIALVEASPGGWKVLVAVFAGLLAGIAEGAAVGWMQWRVIRQVVPTIQRRAWIVATAG